MFCILKKEKMYPAYVLKHNSGCEKQFIILMIPNGKKWHYLSVKKLSALLKRIMSKHYHDFHCLNCLDSFRTKAKLNHIKNMSK